MPSSKPLIALRVGQDLYDKIRASSLAEGRTMTNFLDFYLRQSMMASVPDLTRKCATCGHQMSSVAHAKTCGAQVDIEDAIATVVKRGPSKAAKHK
jgi:hypothetical protein